MTFFSKEEIGCQKFSTAAEQCILVYTKTVDSVFRAL